MAVTGIQPFIKVLDNNGDPIVGAKLYVYEVGTTTERAIYSDADLTTPLSNPLEGANASDANGDFPKFYMAEGEYKLRAVTSAGALIWEEDDLDTGMSAGSGALPVARGGTGATTAAAARANLGAASTSEVSDLSEQIADFSTSLQSVLSQPGGRLTLTSNTPILVSGVTAGTAVYYTPYTSNICPIYDGTQYNLHQFSELTLTLASQHTASNFYDCFIINDSGTVRIVTGPAWSTATAGAGARGTGAGTTEIARLNGLWVNTNAMATARNGATTYSVDAHEGTYVGTLYIDGTNGQITCHTAAGRSRKWGVWNAYNRKLIELQATDSTASWTYATNTIRAANGSSNNCLDIFAGLPEEAFDLNYTTINATDLGAGFGVNATTYIGFNSTSAGSGRVGRMGNTSDSGNSSAIAAKGNLVAEYTAPPAIGYNRITALENGGGGSAATTWLGTATNMILRARWWG